MRLTDEELRAILERAEQIQNAERSGAGWESEVAAVVAAAEEIGISKRAVELALRERTDVSLQPPEQGSLVWARSADGKYYPAEVLSTGENLVRVRYMRGSEHSLPASDVRPCVFLPGEKVVAQWPGFGSWKCTVLAYDARARSVRLSDGWGSELTLPISEVWIKPSKEGDRPASQLLVTAVGVSAAAGAIIGSLITIFIAR